MFGKILMVILLIAMLVLGYVIYYNLPSDPVSLVQNYGSKDTQLIDYGTTPVFWENLRFAENQVSYYIEPGCPNTRRNLMKEAFSIFDEETGIISFFETDYQKADIVVGCSNEFVGLGERMFAAGEGGPNKVMNTSNFKIIQTGEIMLFRKSNCDYPVVELHELMHVFGFDHSPNPNSIMFNISDCGQRITTDMVEIIRKLYSVPSLPDLLIEDVEAMKRGRYLDFEITITNEGLQAAKDVELEIFADFESFETLDIGDLSVGYGRTIKAENIKMPTRDPESILFIVDRDKLIEEINEDNNELVLKARE